MAPKGTDRALQEPNTMDSHLPKLVLALAPLSASPSTAQTDTEPRIWYLPPRRPAIQECTGPLPLQEAAVCLTGISACAFTLPDHDAPTSTTIRGIITPDWPNEIPCNTASDQGTPLMAEGCDGFHHPLCFPEAAASKDDGTA